MPSPVLAVKCPTCFAPAGEACTAPTETSRRVVNWTHFSRDDLAQALRNVS